MADLQLLDCLQPGLVTLERVRYFPRQLLTADDMTADQDYFRQKLRRHNRFLHGWGVVCGLEVTAAPTADMPWQVQIGSGYALGPYGDEIYVGEPVHLDLARCDSGTVTDPCEPDRLHTGGSAIGGQLFLAIKYAECIARPVRAMSAGCACEAEACEYSRIRDSFQIECLAELPPSHQPKPAEPLLCDFVDGRRLPACPPCPSEPWIVLAQVTLPASPSIQVTNSSIDNTAVRRQIYSTAVLQEQLIACCCRERPRPALLKVSGVRILTAPNDPSEPGDVLATMEDPSQSFTVQEAQRPNAIQVEFSSAVNLETVIDGSTFIVQDDAGVFSGQIVQISNNTVRWWAARLPARDYRITLVGEGLPAITSPEGQPLDGEPQQLPSGDNVAGGNFFFDLSVVAEPVPAKVIRVEPPNGAQFQIGLGSTRPPPPDFIEISFDKRLQGATVNPNTVRVVAGPALPRPGTVTYNDATQSARFTPQESFRTPVSGGSITSFTLTVFGSGPDQILDVDGLALDGNSDGSPGGNFKSTFTVAHPIP